MSFGDFSTALKFRDLVTEIAEGVVNRVRPASFTAEVVAINTVSQRAKVRSAGSLPEDEPLEVNFTNQLVPTVARSADGLTPGNFVEISGSPGNYTITKVLSGKWAVANDSSLTMATIIDILNPVGHIYSSVDPINPGILWGVGTWVAWGSGRVPVGVASGQTEFDTPEETGGSKVNTLDAENLPPHSHIVSAHTHTIPSHTHTVASHTHSINSHTHTLNFGYATGTTTTGSGTRVVDIEGETGAGGNGATATINAGGAGNTNSGGGGATGGGGSGYTGSDGYGDTGFGNGSSTPVNNLQPYITLFMFKRTA